MRGFGNPFSTKLCTASEFVGTGYFSGKMYRVDWYPGAIYDPESTSLVWGEIYQVFDFEKLITELDIYEDVLEDESASLYLRRQVPVQVDDGKQLTCWTYLYNQPTHRLPLVEDGRFTNMIE